MPVLDPIAQALCKTLISPNVPDSNLEAANVVDVIADVASGLQTIARKLGGNPERIPDRNADQSAGTLTYAVNRVADAIFSAVETQDGLHRIAASHFKGNP